MADSRRYKVDVELTNGSDTVFRIILADRGEVHLAKGNSKLNKLMQCTHTCADASAPDPIRPDVLDLSGLARLLGIVMAPGKFVAGHGGKEGAFQFNR